MDVRATTSTILNSHPVSSLSFALPLGPEDSVGMDSQQPPASAATTPQMAMEDTLASVQRALASLHQLHCSVSGFQLPSQLLLLERLNGLVSELGVMHSAAQDCHIQIPLEVVSFIDEGRNPDEFTKDLLNSCIQRNQVSKGKVDAFKDSQRAGLASSIFTKFLRTRACKVWAYSEESLRKNLLEQVEEAFPVETEAYREIRNQSSLESRRALQASNLLSNGDLKVKSEH